VCFQDHGLFIRLYGTKRKHSLTFFPINCCSFLLFANRAAE
jgi:hypothetical protein